MAPVKPQVKKQSGKVEFIHAVKYAFTDKVRNDDAFAKALWGALAGVVWQHTDGGTVGWPTAAAGQLIVGIKGGGSPADWHGQAPRGVISDDIAAPLKAAGWVPVTGMATE